MGSKLSYAFLAAFLVSLVVLIFGEAGLISAYKMSQEEARLDARIQRLVAEKQDLEHRMDAIERDPIAVEFEIRKSLSLVAQDELLFKFQN